MFICYQYNCMELVASREGGTILPDAGLDGVDLEAIFSHLVKSSDNFSVACGEGFVRRLCEYVHKHYIVVKAAGGIVRNMDGRLLLMRRNNRWDLPKGKVEEGETLARAAVRETEEETGLGNLVLGEKCIKTYHIYDLYGGWHFKQTTWYGMQHRGNDRLVPQLEEGITEVGWYDENKWLSMLDESYATMRIITCQMTENKR